MAIISSDYRLSPVQPGETVRVIGTATEDNGTVHDIRYFASIHDDHSLVFPEKIIELENSFPTREKRKFEAFIEAGGDPEDFTPVYNTRAQLLKRLLRVFGRCEDFERALTMAKWLNDNVTPAQIEAATSTQVRTKVVSRVTRLLSMEADIVADKTDRVEIN
jgi:hypothetical protein